MASPAVVIKASPVAPVKERKAPEIIPSRLPQFNTPPMLHVNIETGQVLTNRLADVMGQVFATREGEVAKCRK